MYVCTAITLGLLLQAQVILSLIEMCRKRFYLSDDVCKPCPNHCQKCTNATQCTLCQIGYYGQMCENECKFGCTGTCHKVFGHCTYGCEDGTYAEENSLACLDCPKECELCRSKAVCVTCQPGYYGESCRKKCSGLCKDSLCNTTDGTCFECNDGSYTMDRVCVLCPDGCAQCNESHKCTLCNDGFIGPINGCCFLECPNIKEENFSVCNICLNETGSYCNTSLCRNLPPYWKLQSSKCHQAMSFPFHYYTEGICVTSNDSLHALNMEYSPNYMTFKCSLECKGHTTEYLMEPCKERRCKVACELAERANTVETESWVSSTCFLGKSQNNAGRELPTKVIAVSVALVQLCIALVM